MRNDGVGSEVQLAAEQRLQLGAKWVDERLGPSMSDTPLTDLPNSHRRAGCAHTAVPTPARRYRACSHTAASPARSLSNPPTPPLRSFQPHRPPSADPGLLGAEARGPALQRPGAGATHGDNAGGLRRRRARLALALGAVHCRVPSPSRTRQGESGPARGGLDQGWRRPGHVRRWQLRRSREAAPLRRRRCLRRREVMVREREARQGRKARQGRRFLALTSVAAFVHCRLDAGSRWTST
jgi:hypothetical protein